MNRPAWMASAPIAIEIGQDVLRAWHQGVLREWALERGEHGRLAEATRVRLTSELPGFVGRAAWQPKVRGWCAIGARGVSVRRLALPRVADADWARLVALQVETAFPLPADDLAWGYARLPAGAGAETGGAEVIVAAAKREVVNDYATLLDACGIQPVFTLSALVRGRLGLAEAGTSAGFAILSVEAGQSECALFDARGLVAVRTVPWGTTRMVGEMATKSGRTREQAEAAFAEWARGGGKETVFDAVVAEGLGTLAAECSEGPIWLLAATGSPQALAETLRRAIPRRAGWTPLVSDAAGSASAVVRGLESSGEPGSAGGPLELRTRIAEPQPTMARAVPRRWIAIAAGMAAVLLLLPHVEAWMLRPGLERRLKELKAQSPRLALIDREWEFLRYLKQSQPPYLEALHLLTQALPPGTQVESVSMNRRGDMVLRGALRTAQDVVGFRSKLVESGFFSTVVLDEQNPTPDRQMVNYRITAQWKDAVGRSARLGAGGASTNTPAGGTGKNR